MSLSEELKSSDVRLEHIIKKSDTGLVFYRKCTVDGQSYNVGNNVLLRDEGRYKLGYLLKIYCRTKGNERALVRWFFTNIDFGQHDSEQHYSHEIFATSYTGKVAVTSIRKLVHVIWVSNKDEIAENVPKDVYYVYRYFDHDKQALVLHRQQLLQIRYMPKPMPDSVGSSLSIKEKADTNVAEIEFSVPYTQNGSTFYKVCSIGKDKYKIGDCVMLVDRDGSSIRRIISFSYNHDKRPIAMGQFIYYQNEVTLSLEERKAMHFQEVLVSNWKRELLISNIKKKLIVVHQNIFQPVPDNALKAVYFLKRYYDPFKKKIYPLSEPLTRSDFSIVPAPMDDCPHTPQLSGVARKEEGTTYYRKCKLGEDIFSVGNFVTLQSGSVCVRILSLYYDDDDKAVMNVNKLFTIRNVPSTNRSLLKTSLLFSSEVYHKVPCALFFEKICVVFNAVDIVNDTTFVAGDFFNTETKELYELKKPAKSLGVEEVPLAGLSLKQAAQSDEEVGEDSEEEVSSSSSAESEDSDNECPSPKKRKKTAKVPPSDKGRNKVKNTNKEKEKPKIVQVKNEEQAKKKKVEIKVDKAKDEKQKKLEEKEIKEEELMSELMTKEISLGEMTDNDEYSWVKVGDLKANVGDCVFIRLVEGIQIGRIVSIYRDQGDVVRLILFRFFLEEEMFVSKRESTTIHINEAFASDFVVHALAWQIDEAVDVKYLKKKELIPPQDSVPHGRLFVRRYYHPIRHLLRRLAQPLDADDLSIIPQPIPPIPGLNDESKSLNKLPKLPDQTLKSVEKKTSSSKSDQAVSDDMIQKSEEREDEKPLLETEGGSMVESERTKTAVLEPKSVVPQSVSPESPEVEMEDSTEVQQSESTVPNSTLKPESATNYSKISIVPESDVNSQTMTILPENMISFIVSSDTASTQDQPQTVQIIQQSNDSNQHTIEIVPSTTTTVPILIPSSSNDPSNTPTSTIEQVEIVSPSAEQIEIVPHLESSGANQIQIVTSDSNQVQVITDTNSIQIVPTTTTTTSSTTTTFLPTIISSEQDMHTDMDVDITHAEDGCITIAPVAANKRNNTAKFEESYTKDGRVYFRKCHFKNETIVQGDAVYVRCNDQNMNNETESWKLGRVMEFYHSKFPVVRLLWFYVVEEMVTSKNERASIHPQEVFASMCDDEIEISSIESKANVIYLKKGENIPKITEDTTALYCRRFYDPYKHSIKALKNRLSATNISILPEPMVAAKRNRSSQPSTPQEIKTPEVKRKRITSPNSKRSPVKKSVQNTASSTPSPTTPKRTVAPQSRPATESGTKHLSMAGNGNKSKTLETKLFFATELESDRKEAKEKEVSKNSVTKEPPPENLQVRWKISQNSETTQKAAVEEITPVEITEDSETTQKAAVEEVTPVEITEDSETTQTPTTEETEEPQATAKTAEANETPHKPATLQVLVTSATSEDSTMKEETIESQITEVPATLTGEPKDSANQPFHEAVPQTESSQETEPQLKEISESETQPRVEEMKSNESHDLPVVTEGNNKPNVNELADKNNVISDSCTTL